jgi:enoyl-CoA hydratase/carnithine racemase
MFRDIVSELIYETFISLHYYAHKTMSYLPLSPPANYANVQYTQIHVSHVPASSPTPTPVILLTLYRPGKHNAYTETMTQELHNAFTLFSMDDRVRAIVVTGDGRMFCAGADLDISFKYDTERTYRDGGGIISLSIYRCTKPVIGAINGSAVGVGITMTLPMTIRIVSNKAKIGFVFARRGLVMEAASSFFLPRLVGYSKAMHLVTTGAVYPSTSPLLDGLFSEIVEPEQVLPRALALADDIARNTSAVSTAMNKDLIWRGPDSPEGSQLITSKLILEMFKSKDNAEGIKSFLEKRPAQFQGTVPKDAPTAWPWWTQIDADPNESRGCKPKL